MILARVPLIKPSVFKSKCEVRTLCPFNRPYKCITSKLSFTPEQIIAQRCGPVTSLGKLNLNPLRDENVMSRLSLRDDLFPFLFTVHDTTLRYSRVFFFQFLRSTKSIRPLLSTKKKTRNHCYQEYTFQCFRD